MTHQTVIVLDFGGQYNQLIARRVRECGVYCEVKPYTTSISEIKAMEPIGIIFTGGPGSVYAPGSPQAAPELFQLGIPILGICLGHQAICEVYGATITYAR
ncbi:MAG: GMP synthase (glutamine-hydrolyzing), partial [Oscillospiraceae bacterium]|nr:GMP synthase (glutamine-hydrolyzing) [Oscillospiraceae bacterium]